MRILEIFFKTDIFRTHFSAILVSVERRNPSTNYSLFIK